MYVIRIKSKEEIGKRPSDWSKQMDCLYDTYHIIPTINDVVTIIDKTNNLKFWMIYKEYYEVIGEIEKSPYDILKDKLKRLEKKLNIIINIDSFKDKINEREALILSEAFTWSKTKKGHHYWEVIHHLMKYFSLYA